MRLVVVFVAAAAGVLAASSWYFASRGETVEAQPTPSAPLYVSRPQGEPVAQKVRRSSGLQTAVPEVVGYRERVAAYTLENGGFRVRVMEQTARDSREVGTVVQQLPRGGSTRRVGWIVTIFVGTIR